MTETNTPSVRAALDSLLNWLQTKQPRRLGATADSPRWKVWRRRALYFASAGALLWAGCRDCRGDAGLAVEGETPYLRCLAAAPPEEGVHRFGAVVLRIRERTLTIEGLPKTVRLAVFSGPAFAEPPAAGELEALRAAAPKVLFVLGGVGDTPELAAQTVRALLAVRVPTVVLAGGRDSRRRIADAIEAADSGAKGIIDVTSLDAVRIGSDTLLPVAGTYEGRQALGKDGCGYAESDLDERLERLRATAKTRSWLLAWEAPGHAALAVFAGRTGARGGLFAWPYRDLMRPRGADGRKLAPGEVAEDLQLVVPRWSGPAMQRPDGSRVTAGFALIELSPAGLRLLETAPLRAAAGPPPQGNSPGNQGP